MQKLIKYLTHIIHQFTALNVVKKIIVICVFFIVLLTFGIVINSIKSKFNKYYLSPIEKFKIDSTNAVKTEIKIKGYQNRINSSDSSSIRDSVQIANGLLVQ